MGQPGRPGQAARHRPLLRHRRQQPGLVLRLDRARCTTRSRDTGRAYGADFPVVTVEDWVDAQARLLDALGIEQLAAVLGGSLGGMQALRLVAALSRAAAPLHRGRDGAQPVGAEHRLQRSGAARHRHRPRLPRRPLLRARRGAQARPARGADDRPHHLPVRRRDGGQVRPRPAGRGARSTSTQEIEFQIESYLRHQGDKFSEYFDANTYLLITRALDYFDPARGARRRPDRDLRARRAASSSWSASPPTGASRRRARARSSRRCVDNRRDVSYAEIDAPHGHDAFLLDDPRYHGVLRACFERNLRRRSWRMSDRKDIELIAELVPQGSRVLDLGCGDGELLAHLRASAAAAATASRSTTPTCSPARSAAST